MVENIIFYLKLRLKGGKFFKIALLLFSLFNFVFLSNMAKAATLDNSGEKAVTIMVAEKAARRDYVIDTKKAISFCLKGCFITLANGDRYALTGNEVMEISGNRINFH